MHALKGVTLETQSGDITAIHPMGNPWTTHFFTEIKFRAKLDMERMLFGGKPYDEYWNKPIDQAKFYGKQPFVLMKQNRQDQIVWVRKRAADWFASAFPSLIPLYRFHRLNIYSYSFMELLNCPYANLDRVWKR